MKKRNIYQNQSQEIVNLFEAAGSNEKIMCVPMDYAKKQRGNIQASTDRIDLMGIAAMLLNCRANCCHAQSGIYRNLRLLVRHRRKLIEILKRFGTSRAEKTAAKLQQYAGMVLHAPVEYVDGYRCLHYRAGRHDLRCFI